MVANELLIRADQKRAAFCSTWYATAGQTRTADNPGTLKPYMFDCDHHISLNGAVVVAVILNSSRGTTSLLSPNSSRNDWWMERAPFS